MEPFPHHPFLPRCRLGSVRSHQTGLAAGDKSGERSRQRAEADIRGGHRNTGMEGGRGRRCTAQAGPPPRAPRTGFVPRWPGYSSWWRRQLWPLPSSQRQEAPRRQGRGQASSNIGGSSLALLTGLGPLLTWQDHTREVDKQPHGRGEPALPTPLAPGPWGLGGEPGGPGQAHEKYPGTACPSFQGAGGGSTPGTSSRCQGCCSGYSRSISGVLWAPTENREAGRGPGSGRPWAAGHHSVPMTGGQRGPRWLSLQHTFLPGEPRGGSLCPMPGPSISGGSSSQMFSRSPVALLAVGVWKCTRRRFRLSQASCAWGQALLCLQPCGLGHPWGCPLSLPVSFLLAEAQGRETPS